MINRPEFSRSIGTADDIHNMFDEVMALYNIVSDMYIDAKLTAKTELSATFEIIFKDNNMASKVCNTIDGKSTVIYDTPMKISCSVSNIILVILIERV